MANCRAAAKMQPPPLLAALVLAGAVCLAHRLCSGQAKACAAFAPLPRVRSGLCSTGQGSCPWASRLPVAAAAEGDVSVGKPTPSPEEVGFSRAAFGVGLMALGEVLRSFLSYSQGGLLAAAGQLLSVAPVLLVARASCEVLRGAAARGRLSGGTFRVLSLGLLSAFAMLLFDALFRTSSTLILIRGSAQLVPLGLAAVTAGTAVSGLRAAYGVLAAEGLPKWKLEVRSEKRPRWLLTLLAAGYAATALHQVLWGGAMLLYSKFKLLGALRCFVVAACAHVCQTAAVAGPKRLNSESYRTLNIALFMDGAARIALLVASSSSLSAGLRVFPAVELICAAGGWMIGKTYKLSE
ncbi:unnamed protein product [Polarella glacialis]|uniref:Solute carrier family 40 protein n=1 Tax=Polarella glacialis TaxID=89957 RepID=A0A813E5S7_POLGL|nr:unnamed protein product [Polarella glacialis]CAE8687600.1 unnamed protein product [Polarella glacialis]